MKKVMTHTLLLCMAVISAVPVAATAQEVGSWEIVPSYGGNPGKVIDTDGRTYVVSQNKLTVFDNGNGEILSYSLNNYLTDSKVDNVYHDPDKDMAVVVYTNGNMDILYDNGRTVNVSALRDATLNTDKRVRDVSFHDGRIYVAGDFGYFCINSADGSVIESVTDTPLMAAFVLDDRLIVCTTDYRSKWSKASDRHFSISSFNDYGGGGHESVGVLPDGRYYTVSGGELYLAVPDENFTDKEMHYLGMREITGKFTPMKDGGYFVHNHWQFAVLSPEGTASVYTMPSEVAGNVMSSYEGLGSIKVATGAGLAEYSCDPVTGSMTQLGSPARPEGISSAVVSDIYQGPSGRIYFTSTRPSNHLSGSIHPTTRGYADYYDGMGYRRIEPAEIPHTNSSYSGNEFRGNYRMTENPHVPGSVLFGNFFEGVFRIDVDNNKITGKYDYTNSTIPTHADGYANAVSDQAFDRQGNLWVLAHHDNDNYTLHFLAADKCGKSSTTAQDWQRIKLDNFQGQKEGKLLICSKSNMIFITGSSSLVGYDTKGTWSDLSDDTFVIRSSMTDQDGLTVTTFSYFIPAVEDKDGKVWIGHRRGIVEISNPATFTSSTFRMTRLKVPRNDGTSLADYLLDGENVISIAVDGANRKWIGTQSSGLYLANPSGSEVLRHFTTDNSDLPSDCVYSVLCDRESNKVYVGTDAGLAIYSSDASPAHEDYSDVYAYPNPVRPDHTGPVTVTGLMENSLVKIADSAGNVFYSGRSEGGMITWDGCDRSGRRARTGVYFVYMSQSDGSSSSGAVTKILVVN